MNFLRKENTINDTSAGYFQKGINAILNKRGTDFLTYFFRDNIILDSFIGRLNYKAIMEISIRILFLDFINEDLKKEVFLNERKSFLYGIIENFKRSSSYEAKENIIKCFNKIFIEDKEDSLGIGLLDIFLAKERIYDFLELIQFSKSEENVLLYLNYLKIVMDQFDYYLHPEISQEIFLAPANVSRVSLKTPRSIQQNLQEKNRTFSKSISISKSDGFYGYDKDSIIKISIKITQSLMPLLFPSEEKLEEESRNRKFGEIRLTILELITLTLKISNGSQDICEVFVKNDFLGNLQGLMTKFCRNNLFHIALVSLMKEYMKIDNLCLKV